MADVAEIFEGRVFSVMNFGAFVRLKDGSTGLVHISEITDGFVQDVKDYLKVGQTVQVVVLSEESDGKKKFSIKRIANQPRLDGRTEAEVKAETKEKQAAEATVATGKEKKKEKPVSRTTSVAPPPDIYGADKDSAGTVSFEDKLSKFMKNSEERLVDIKHRTENKRGGGYVRR
ncbi:MAG: S1 RNA-binding domain-containing protein [Ruminococcaceae bacterium]|nr:S1 RNA-binding domain-containing protein [Oscillospiraceae bacterium]